MLAAQVSPIPIAARMRRTHFFIAYLRRIRQAVRVIRAAPILG